MNETEKDPVPEKSFMHTLSFIVMNFKKMMKKLTPFAHPYVISKLFDIFSSSLEHKIRCFEKCVYCLYIGKT